MRQAPFEYVKFPPFIHGIQQHIQSMCHSFIPSATNSFILVCLFITVDQQARLRIINLIIIDYTTYLHVVQLQFVQRCRQIQSITLLKLTILEQIVCSTLPPIWDVQGLEYVFLILKCILIELLMILNFFFSNTEKYDIVNGVSGRINQATVFR